MTEICKGLGLHRSRYYRGLSPRPIKPMEVKLKAALRHIHQEMDATYGSRRMQTELSEQGLTIGRYKVRRLMKSMGLHAKRPKRHRYPVAGQPSMIAPNHLNRQFNPDERNTHWSGDITYIRTGQGWLYLAIVMDLYSRRVIGWAFSAQPNSELSTRSLQLAVAHRRPDNAVLLHTDQGVQYAGDAFLRSLQAHHITASMSRRGNCLDNAVTERFFRSLKSERVNYRQYQTRAHAMADIADYIEPFYNRKRRHSTLGNISPVEYEQRYQKKADKVSQFS